MQWSTNKQVAILATAMVIVMPVAAQTTPGAGLIYQENRKKELQPLTPSVDLKLQGQPLTQSKSGGPTVEINHIDIEGNRIFSLAELMKQLGDVLHKSYDLGGLRALADKISLFYRARGYVFARAVLPPQTLDGGILKIVVIEGQYGRINASGPPDLASAIQPYLYKLHSGDTISSASLERTMMVLGDLPGVSISPVLRPGQQYGEGDLDVQVLPNKRIHTRIGADNYGSRFSGEYRGSVDIQADRLLKVGDELAISLLYSTEDTWLSDIHYELPLGYSGIKGNIGYAHTDYNLGKGFEGYTGSAKVSSIGVSYPLVRGQSANLIVGATFQYKKLDDDADFLGYAKATDSRSLPLIARFDYRDSFAGGGVTYGAFTYTPGLLDIHQSGADGASYHFNKINLDVMRLQWLGHRLRLYGHFSGQWSDRKNLDGSESFYLGGPYGVRAFPIGEGADSKGWLAQLELRYHTDAGFIPYLFADTGYSPNGGIDEGDDRTLSGSGVGLKFSRAGLVLDVSVAWKLEGGDALSDNKQRDPRIWATAAYQF